MSIYSLSLRETDRNALKNSHSDAKVGQVVLIYENDTPRQFWKMGIITKLYLGRDKVVRLADVKIGNGIFTRPLVRLYPLELDVSCSDVDKLIENSNYCKPRRKAAEQALNKIKTLNSDSVE